MENYSQFKKWLIAFAVFSGTSVGLVVSPIVQTMALDYPDVPLTTVRLITTIPSLISTILGLFLASTIGKKLPYKVALIFGHVFMLIGGLMPVFWNETFTPILISRVVYGFGFSVFAMRNAIITKALGTKESAMWIGYGVTIGNVLSVIIQLLGGVLGDINWRYCFALHALSIPMLLIILGIFKEPGVVEDTSTVNETKPKGKFNPVVLLYTLITLVTILCAYPILSSISVFIYERGLGAATEASFASSAFIAGSAIFGIFFGRIYNKLSRWLLPISATVAILGYILTLSATNGPFLAVLGSALVGAGFTGGISLTLSKWCAEASDESYRPLSMTLISFATSGGSFISSYFMTFAKKVGAAIPLFETEIEKTFLVGIIIYAIVAIITLVFDFRPSKLAAKK